mgnify:CR=1 FL=1
MDFPFNFIIIPVLIIALAYYNRGFVRKGLKTWYKDLKKPQWAPRGSILREMWFFLYVITGLAVMWYWNVPARNWLQYVVGGILLANAYLYMTWNKQFFADNNLKASAKTILRAFVVLVVAVLLMVKDSPIAVFLMMPYLAWLGVAYKMNKEIINLNKVQEK